MKKILFLPLFLLLAACSSRAPEIQQPAGKGFIRLRVYDEGIIRVTVSPVKELKERPSLMVIARPLRKKGWQKKEDDRSAELITPRLTVRLDKEKGTLLFLNRQGDTLLQAGRAALTPVTVPGETDQAYSITQSFLLSPGESVYGLGQYQDGVMDLRGHDRILFQENRQAVTPFFVTTKNYGILWDNYSLTKFHDGADGTTMWSKVADAVDYYFIAGDNLDGVIGGYRHLTGQAPLYGRWAYGYWQCRERYHTQEELLDVVREYRRRHLPLDDIVQDWLYWGSHGWNAIEFDSTRYPDPKGMIDSVHARHAHIMISIWPNFAPQTTIYKEMKEKGYLITGRQSIERGLYDPYNPEARDHYWKWLNRNIFSLGMDAWWMDATEPEVSGATLDERVAAMEHLGTTHLGSMARYLLSYSLMSTKGVYENQRRTTDQKRVYILTRSAYAGQQRYAATTWSGDIHARWEVFRHQITAGVNFCMAGIPYWTTDIGAFFPDDPLGNRDNAYRELYLRWFQFGTFCPIFRSHGTGTPREIYNLGGEGSWTYHPLKSFDELRYRLLPYIYSLAWQVTSHGYTLMRGLPMDFPADTTARKTGDEYMFGPAFLVAPVTEKMYFEKNYTGEVIPSSALYDDKGQKGSLSVRFYQGTDFDTLKTKRNISKLNINWNDGTSLPSQVNKHYFSVRMTGEIRPEETGKYTFLTTSNDGIRVKIGGKTVVENWTGHGVTIDEGTITLEAHKKYPITLEYFQLLGNATTKLAWIPPSVRDTLRKPRLTQVRNKQVYLPAGAEWYDFWRGDSYTGGQTVQVPAPVSEMPLFVRAGSILPMGPVMEYATQKPADPIELRIYTGADAHFVLYEDENDNYDYEKGVYITIPVTWDEEQQTLTIGSRRGSFPGMLKKRTFRIVWVEKGHGTGIYPEEKADKVVEYEGKEVKISKK